MKTNEELVTFCKEKLGTPYVYGMKGTVLTEAKLKQLKRDYPTTHTSTYQEQARKYLGHICTDCSGLISWCTGIIRGSSDYHDTAVESKLFSQLDESMVGWALWKKGHIGVYIGKGECIEAKGIAYGTVKTNVRDNKSWQMVLKLKDIQYICETAHRWYQDLSSKKWYWYDENGQAVHEEWLQYGGAWYYFNKDSSMVTGIKIIDWKIYYFSENGTMAGRGMQAIAMMLKKIK